MNQKLTNQEKKKIIIISAGLLLLLLISAIITVTVIYFQSKDHELSQHETNILYYSESENEVTPQNEVQEGENNVLVVGIEDENEPNENQQKKEEPKKDIPYYIKVNNQANVVTIYKKDSKGEYTKPVKAMICSIGTATPESGVYTMSDKYTWRLLQGDVYGQYACRIVGHILFHSVPYEEQDKSTLEWWEYDKLGTKASLGCIRLTVEDAKWIYDNCTSGTKVEFYSSSNPGPLGKPTAQKISDDEEVRNWDPTDPDTNNPWKDYKPKQEEAEEVSAEPVKEESQISKEERQNTSKNEIQNTVVNDQEDNKNQVTKNEINKNNTINNTVNNKNPEANTNKQNTVTNTNKVKNEIDKSKSVNKI